jgi:mycothiol S-conjugate amidase
VVITYPDIQDGYAHPDHLRVHDITPAAIRVAANGTELSWAGPAWDVPKLYYTLWTRARMQATHNKLLELGLESPFEPSWFRRPWQDFRTTTRIDTSRVYGRRKADEVAAEVHPWEEYHLARSTVPVELPETDLFTGIGQPAYDAAG